MNLEMRRGVLLVSGLAAGLLLAGCGGVSRRDYVAKNEAIVRSLPLYRGAVKAHEISTQYSNSEGGLSTKPDGYMTTVVYRVPTGTPAASVLRFYETRLHRRGWQSVGKAPIGAFTRDGAAVAVNTVFLTPKQQYRNDWIYELVADYRGGRR
jgi:hypothetical protein